MSLLNSVNILNLQEWSLNRSNVSARKVFFISIDNNATDCHVDDVRSVFDYFYNQYEYTWEILNFHV